MKLTLRSVISIIAGVSIIAISATVIAIVSTLYTDAAKKIGISYAKQLGKSGAELIEGYLVEQYYLIQGITTSLLSRPNQVSFPDENPSMNAGEFCDEARTIFKTANGTLSQLAIVFDDKGSMFFSSLVSLPNGTAAIRCALSNSHNSDVTGYGIATHLCFDYNTRQQYDDLAIFPPTWGTAPQTSADNRPTLWATGKTIAIRLFNTFYPPPVLIRRNVIPPDTFLVFPSSTPIRNSSNIFLGAVVANINLKVLTDFVNDIDLSDGSYAFVIYSSSELILASTHPAPIATLTDTVSTVSLNGCYNSAQTNAAAVNSEYCPVSILNYAFRPLAILRERNETIFTKPHTFEDLEMNVEGERYLVSNYKLSNPGELFGISVTFFIYYNTIIGDIESARNISIGVGLGIFAIAVAISVALVFVLLAPLEVVSMQMNATSKLRLRLARRIGGETDNNNNNGNNNNNNNNNTSGSPKYTNLDVNNINNVDEDGNEIPAAVRGRGKSSILELFLLQKAYTNMHAAVDSFTRYIPKDLVKNLLATGQLTKNTASGTSGVSRGLVSMTQKNNTMLMADVQGFTSISERVQIGDLSPVLSIFFEHMSSAIMQHEGIIVMYIGDAISATFGGDFACEYPQVKACLAALQMTRETCMPTLSDAFASIGETLNLRIGINSGVVLSGILGSRDRVAYSILGQASDLASSLEAWNKKFKTRVLISDVVAQEVERFFLVRCVYTNRRFREQSDLENQSGIFVVSPDNAKEYWKKNAERIKEAKSGAAARSSSSNNNSMNYSSMTPNQQQGQIISRTHSWRSHHSNSGKGNTFLPGPNDSDGGGTTNNNNNNTAPPPPNALSSTGLPISPQQSVNNVSSSNINDGNNYNNDNDNDNNVNQPHPNLFLGGGSTSNPALGVIQQSDVEREQSHLMRQSLGTNTEGPSSGEAAPNNNINNNNNNNNNKIQIADGDIMNNINTTDSSNNGNNNNFFPTLLCYEVVGLLPLDRVVFSAIEELPRVSSRMMSPNQSASGVLNISYHSDDEDPSGTGTDTNDETRSFSMSNATHQSMAGFDEKLSSQQNNNSAANDGDDGVQGEITSGVAGGEKSNNNNRRKYASSNKRKGQHSSSNRGDKKKKKKSLAELFHDAAGLSSTTNNNGDGTMMNNKSDVEDSSNGLLSSGRLPYPCSIVATPEEIEFCTKYTAAILSSDASSQQIQQLYEKYPAFFYCGGGSGEDAAAAEEEEERLQNLRNIVGMNRCPASLINAFRSRVRETLA